MTDPELLTRFQTAFPVDISGDVKVALGVVPSSRSAWSTGPMVSAKTIDGDRLPADVHVHGQLLSLPARTYIDVAPPAARASLTSRQTDILGCVYTRHHDGFTRQEWLRRIIDSREEWTLPFVVQLVGEHVIEIVADIAQRLPDLADPASPTSGLYGRFLASNAQFWKLTTQRIGSYWDCYYRGRYPDPDHYPAFILKARLDAAVRQHRTG
ncbi:hypothetical protein [Kineosporia sp. R_H_3]|uniref:hypothetical protein n=1 Tax=Kineosporia sp. R_H_3 TaxID=1961848 RepID=UPI000B4BCFB1|nr:hypothetical protein [Kineosporia sp. R_H_3]